MPKKKLRCDKRHPRYIEFVKLLRICYRCILLLHFFPDICGIPALTFNNCLRPLSFVLYQTHSETGWNRRRCSRCVKAFFCPQSAPQSASIIFLHHRLPFEYPESLPRIQSENNDRWGLILTNANRINNPQSFSKFSILSCRHKPSFLIYCNVLL